MFNQTPFQLLWEASSHMLQLMCEGCSYTYPPLSITRYSFIQLSELEQRRVIKLAQAFNTTGQDSNLRSLCRSIPEPLPTNTVHSEGCFNLFLGKQMRNYNVATCKHDIIAKHSCEVGILAYFERGGLEKQRGGPPHSSFSRGNSIIF